MPDTNAYLALGMAVITVILGGFVGALFLRFRNAKRNLNMLISLREEN
ncbi:MAG: hypothetical protein IPK19_36700 [Chloroflexi bacterium]|nr:hypothetical protein [Chloroflexota bacterium]